MKKAIIIGCPGSGKTTFAEKLNRCTGLPLFYLDVIWHKPDRTHISREEYDKIVDGIFKLDEWIIDGNYSRTIEKRIVNCDTVFLFDLPTDVCIQGAVSRLGKKRLDVPFADDKLDPEFKKQIEEFPFVVLPRIYELLEKHKANREITVFKSRKQADEYIKQIQASFFD